LALGRQVPGLEAIGSLAGLCQTSLTATAIRYAELTDDTVAIIISTGPLIEFCFMSDTIKALSQLSWLLKRTPVPTNTATAKLGASARHIADGSRAEAEIDIMDWLGGARSVKATEQVVGLGTYGKTLTVLTCTSIQDETYQEDDGDDDEDLAEGWTPRFRR
jgi:hypothetical protein